MHRHLILSIIEALQEIFGTESYADKVLERMLRSNKKWGSRDRKFVAETTYDVVRWWRKLWFLLEKDQSLKADDLWELLAVYFSLLAGKELPTWQEFSSFDISLAKSRVAKANAIRAVRESIPDWLDQRGFLELGEPWALALAAMNEKAHAVLRVNRLKAEVAQVQKKLSAEGISTHTNTDFVDALILSERKNVFTTASYKEGLFEMQDASSQLIAPLLEVKPGERVIDACAGAGGKTLHLAAQMKNKGRIIAMDISDFKLEELRKRASRAGVDIVETRVIESSKTIKRLESSCDKLLLDVPCSGLGVLRRSPDTKWKLTDSEIERVRAIQKDILLKYSAMVKPGGKMVYATCSILPSENQNQISWFLEESKGAWKLEAAKVLLPHVGGFDGFYAARLVKA